VNFWRVVTCAGQESSCRAEAAGSAPCVTIAITAITFESVMSGSADCGKSIAYIAVVPAVCRGPPRTRVKRAQHKAGGPTHKAEWKRIFPSDDVRGALVMSEALR